MTRTKEETPRRTVLIQLVGKQTIPNMLPVLMLKPDAVYNIFTSDTEACGKILTRWVKRRFKGKVQAMMQKLREGNLYAATRRLCQKLEANHPGDQLVYNMTGGTKLMALAAYQAGVRSDSPVLYVDFGSAKDYESMLYWVHGEGSAYVKGVMGTRPFERPGIVDILEVGSQPLDHKSIQDWHAMVPAAKAVQKHADKYHTAGPGSDLKKLRRVVASDAALARSFKAAGCEFRTDGGAEKLNDIFLTGGWWEVLTADYLERTGNYREVLCSVKTTISAECNDVAEVDVLATDGMTLTSVSCKRHIKSPDSEINKHAARSMKLGGVNVKCGVAVYEGTPASFERLCMFARAQGFMCLLGHEVCPGKPAPAPPAPAQKKKK